MGYQNKFHSDKVVKPFKMKIRLIDLLEKAHFAPVKGENSNRFPVYIFADFF